MSLIHLHATTPEGEPVTIAGPVDTLTDAVRLLRDTGHQNITARVAPLDHPPTPADWDALFAAEAHLRTLGLLQTATYNE